MATTRVLPKNYSNVQALRAVAALLVVIHHAISSWRERILNVPEALPWPNAQSGVDIFFVISGFVMMVSTPGLTDHGNKGWVFFRRRLIRIVPLYWIFTTFKLMRLKYGPAFAGQTPGTTWHIIGSYLFIPTLNYAHNPLPLLGLGWTLNFEMMFYVFFAVALALEIAPLTFLVPTFFAMAIVGFFHHSAWPVFTVLISPLVLEFLYGTLLGHFALRQRLPGTLASTILLLAGFALILTMPLPTYEARAFVWGLPAVVVLLGAVGLEVRIGRRLPRWILELGNASYSIYLVHLFILSSIWATLVHFGQAGGSALAEMIALSLIASVTAGEIVHRLIELPLMILLRGKRVSGISTLPAESKESNR